MRRRLIPLILIGGLVIAAALVTLALPPVRARVSLAPLYLRTKINALRPTAIVPTPPAVSAISPAELLLSLPEGTATASPAATASLPPLMTPTHQPASPTSAPSATATATVATIAITPAAPAIALAGFTHAWQTWNNCGPTTVSMNLSYFGVPSDQAQAAQSLKPTSDDKNVSPGELAAYAREQGMRALVRTNGNITLLESLLSNGFPVIVETWLDPADRGGLGHYRLFSGYDHAGGYFLAQDSLRGADIQVPAAEFEALWRVFNRKYIVIYGAEDEERLLALLGPAADEAQMMAATLRTAQEEAQQDAADAYAWFNMGSSYVALGEMALAASAFDEARRIGLPYRMLWYQFEPFEAYLSTGRYAEVIDLATATLQATGGLEELYYYRGLARQAQGEHEVARRDFEAALNYNAHFAAAAAALAGAQETPTPTVP